MKKVLLSLIITVSTMLSTVWAYDFSTVVSSGQTLYFNINSNTVSITYPGSSTYNPYNGYTQPTGNLVIPETISYNGTTYSVTSIGNYAFSNCSSLTSVTIPDSITSIGNYAFENCSGLTSVTIPYSVTSIGNYAFKNCSGLTSVIIPNSVTSIGYLAFSNCSGLTSITIPNSVTSIGNNAFLNVNNIVYHGSATGIPWGAYSVNGVIDGNFIYSDSTKTELIRYLGMDTNVTIPNSVTSIGSNVFKNCSSLTSVTILNSVISVGDYAFYGCSSLTSVTMPNSVISVGDYAFYGCSSLTSVTIPDSITTIGSCSFYNCRGLTSVTIPNSVTSIGNSVFYNCRGLTSVTIPNSVTSIGGHAFFGCSSLTSITLPDSLTSIETHCFYSCSSLTSIVIPSSITSLGNYAFDCCYSLQKVYFEGIIPPTITSSSFAGCGSVLFYVPCQSINAYRNASYWSNYSSRIYGMNYDWEHSYDFVLNNDSLGMLYFEPIDCDSNVVVTVIPYEGYQFVGWSDGGTENPRTFHLIGDTMVTAIIDYVSYTIIGQSNDTIRGTVVGSNTVHYGDSVFIEALPNYGYHFTQWDDGNTDNPRLIVVTWDAEDTNIIVMETHNVTYTALFDKNNYNVSLAVDDDSHGYVTGMGAYEYLDVCTISAIANEGYRFTHWSDGNTDNPRTITIDRDTSITAFFTDYIIPQICMVSVQNGRNTVLWEKGLEVENYNIYRESNIADEYELVAIVPYDSLSVWVDTVSKPTSRSYRYRMTATDTSGYESEPGDVHKTMHLTINKGIANQWNLVWTEYEGAPYTTYVIYRGTNASNIQQIDVMPAGGNTTYTDENAQEGDVYYQVGVMMSSPCNPSKSSSVIMSNIATNGNVGIQNIDLTDVNIFSRMGEIIVENPSGKSIQVLDAVGRIIYITNNTSYNDFQVSISVPKSGVYLVKVGDSPAKKVVVVK